MKQLRKHFIIGCLVLFAIFLSIYLLLGIYIGIRTDTDTKTKSDVILVLGAKSYRGNSYNPCLVSRVEHAVALYKEKYAPKILVSGGNDKEDTVNEAETMKKIAMELGVPSHDIILEPAATSTYENLLLAQNILDERELNSAIIVTEPFHMFRAALVAEKLSLNYTVSPAETSPCWQQGTYISRYFLKEPLAIIVYKLQGKL